MKKIILAGFQHETNTFASSTADMEAFRQGGGWPGICHGEQIPKTVKGSNIPVAGFIESASAKETEVICTTWAAASPSAHVEASVYDEISGRILKEISDNLPADGIYLDLHGAMVAQNFDDGEGELLKRVRKLVGDNTPIIASLDLHANVTEDMMEYATALVSYRTYPHVDMAETGKKAFDLLWQCMAGFKPVVSYKRLPFLLPTCWQSTMMEPAKSIYEDFEALEKSSGIASLSFTMGFPAADFYGCTPMVWAYAADKSTADSVVKQMYDRVIMVSDQFAGKLYYPDEAVSEAISDSKKASKPIVIADSQDNPGAGANSDTTGILRELLKQGASAALGLIVDAESAKAAHTAGEGNRVKLSLGGKSDVAEDSPLEAEFIVEKLSDGNFKTVGDYYGGCTMALGPSACLLIDNVRVVVTSQKAQMADRAMFSFVGIKPETQKILVLKSTAHFRADFTPIAEKIIVCTAPGDMQMRTTELPWTALPDDLQMYPGGPTFKEWQASK